MSLATWLIIFEVISVIVCLVSLPLHFVLVKRLWSFRKRVNAAPAFHCFLINISIVSILSICIRLFVETPLKTKSFQEFLDQHSTIDYIAGVSIHLRTLPLSLIIQFLDMLSAINRACAVLMPTLYRSHAGNRLVYLGCGSIYVLWIGLFVPYAMPDVLYKWVPSDTEVPTYSIRDDGLKTIWLVTGVTGAFVSIVFTFSCYVVIALRISCLTIIGEGIKNSVKRATYVAVLCCLGWLYLADFYLSRLPAPTMGIIVILLYHLTWVFFRFNLLQTDLYRLLINIANDLGTVTLPWSMMFFFPEMRGMIIESSAESEAKWAIAVGPR